MSLECASGGANRHHVHGDVDDDGGGEVDDDGEEGLVALASGIGLVTISP